MRNKIILGLGVGLVIAGLIAYSAVQASRLTEARAELRAEQSSSQRLRAELESQVRRGEVQEARFESLASSVDRMAKAQTDNQVDLTRRLNIIQNITQQTGDSDESISCLDMLVPRQLDDSVRGWTATSGRD